MKFVFLLALLVVIVLPFAQSQCGSLSVIQDNFRYPDITMNTTQAPRQVYFTQMYVVPNTSTYNAAGVGLLARNFNPFTKANNVTLRFGVYSAFPNATLVASTAATVVDYTNYNKYIVANVFYLPFIKPISFAVAKSEIEWYIGIWADQPINYLKGSSLTSYQSTNTVNLLNQDWPMKMNWTSGSQNTGQTYTAIVGCLTQNNAAQAM